MEGVFRPNRAPRNCKISWVIPGAGDRRRRWRGYSSLFRPIGEGDPQGGGGIPYSCTLPVASRHPSVGGNYTAPIPPLWGGGIPHPPRHSVALPSAGGELRLIFHMYLILYKLCTNTITILHTWHAPIVVPAIYPKHYFGTN